MPNLSGVELVRKLRGEGNNLPAILMSGDMPTDELKRHPELQLAATLTKPFTGDQLLATVKQVLDETDSVREHSEPSASWRSRRAAQGIPA